MPVTIRLSRHGSKKKPFYRIVAADSRKPRDGRFLEQLGTYDPLPTPAEVKVKPELLEKWLSRGARPSETVATVLRRSGYSVKVGSAVKTGAPAAEEPAAEAPTAASEVPDA